MTRAAVCSCGQLSVTLSGEPREVTVCHCLQCQKSTGSVFGVYAFWPSSACRATDGEASCWRRFSDSGHWVESYFCPTCGSTVYWRTERASDEIGIGVGGFADPRLSRTDCGGLGFVPASVGRIARRLAAASGRCNAGCRPAAIFAKLTSTHSLKTSL